MSLEENYIKALLRKSLGIEKEPLIFPEEKFEKIERIIVANGILLTVYNQLPVILQQRLKGRYLAALKQSIVQDSEGAMILKALSDAGFDCIALKGWELRKLYPDVTMRQMADLDILVRNYDFDGIKKVMDVLHYTSDGESSWMHDNFRKKEITVEMHKRLSDDSDVIAEWENGIWDRTVLIEGHIYKMSLEDYYIFHFVHLYKDFRNGSLGLRRIVDSWLLQKKSVNMTEVSEWFDRMNIRLFHERMVRLSRVCMGEKESDEDTDVLMKHALHNGIYGTDKSYKAARISSMGANLKSGKRRSIVSAVFLPYKRMKAHFPILKRWPILLPFCWIKRIFHYFKGDRKGYLRKMDYSGITNKEYREMQKYFKAGGV